MSAAVDARQDRQIKDLQRRKTGLRFATVVHLTPTLDIQVGAAVDDADTPQIIKNVRAVGGSNLAVGNRVPVLVRGNDWLILGGIGDGKGGGGGGPYQPANADLTTLSSMPTGLATAIRGMSPAAREVIQSSSRGDLRATLREGSYTQPITVYGHSINLNGSSGRTRGIAHRVAQLLQTDLQMWATGGSILTLNGSGYGIGGTGGWDVIARRSRGIPGTQSNWGVGIPRRGPSVLNTGVNDMGVMPAQDFAGFLPFRHAYRWAISRLLASNVYENRAYNSSDPTGGGTAVPEVTFAGSWTHASAKVTDENALVACGNTYSYCTATGGGRVITFTVPADYQGSVAALAFLNDSSGRGGLFEIAVNGDVVGTLDARSVPLAGALATDLPLVFRCTGIAAGDVITITPTALNGRAIFDAAWLEADDPSPVACILQYYALSAYSPESIDVLNESIESVVGEFGTTVFSVATEDLMQGDARLFNDAIHPNDRGHAKIAARIVDSILQQAKLQVTHARQAHGFNYLTRNPTGDDRNNLQAHLPDTIPLHVREADFAERQRVPLTRWERFEGTPMAAIAPGGILDLSPANAFAYVPALTNVLGRAGEYISATFTATRLSTSSAVLTSIADTSAVSTGDALLGTGIPAGATVLSKTASTITMSANATATGTATVTAWRINTLGTGTGDKIDLHSGGFGFGIQLGTLVAYTAALVMFKIAGPSPGAKSAGSTYADIWAGGGRFAGVLDLTNVLSGVDASSGTGTGDKLALHSGGFGLGVQLGQMVVHTTPGGLVSIKEANLGGGAKSAGGGYADLYCKRVFQQIGGIGLGGMGSMFDHFADAGNVGAGEDDLYLDAIPANTLATNGDKLIAWYQGTYAANGNGKRIRLRFGPVVLFDDGGAISQSGGFWRLHVYAIRAAANSVRFWVHFYRHQANGNPTHIANAGVGTVTLSSAQDLRLTAEATANNDIVAKAGNVTWEST